MTARSDMDEAMLEQALAWQTALESDDADWDGYMAWLEADPRHREAFDTVALLSAMVEDHRVEIADVLEAKTPMDAASPEQSSRRFLYLGGGLAAAVALIVAVPMIQTAQSVERYSADGGKSRTIALGDGISVTLSPASQIVIRGKNARQIELAKGEAYFDIRHDPARQLSVAAGDYRIVDIGTRFTVNRLGTALRVGVADGRVTVASATMDQPVPVAAGQQLTGDATSVTLSPAPSTDVGSWRAGRLSYTDTPIAMVVGDIVRYTGRPVSIDPSLEKRHFSGTLVIGDGSNLLADLASVLAIEVQRKGRGFHLRSGTAAR
ncbi:FecR family protein [Sphingobium sp. HWE2-09]|uniref:FecR family protein n=1 Tax=Sphingobium sp. HWE2-09 TaxID=3108390 RepID=UPI002DD1B86D|nr:FecR domain-containing protein [Sphingobium sp. HWE2-09]